MIGRNNRELSGRVYCVEQEPCFEMHIPILIASQWLKISIYHIIIYNIIIYNCIQYITRCCSQVAGSELPKNTQCSSDNCRIFLLLYHFNKIRWCMQRHPGGFINYIISTADCNASCSQYALRSFYTLRVYLLFVSYWIGQHSNYMGVERGLKSG